MTVIIMKGVVKSRLLNTPNIKRWMMERPVNLMKHLVSNEVPSHEDNNQLTTSSNETNQDHFNWMRECLNPFQNSEPFSELYRFNYNLLLIGHTSCHYCAFNCVMPIRCFIWLVWCLLRDFSILCLASDNRVICSFARSCFQS